MMKLTSLEVAGRPLSVPERITVKRAMGLVGSLFYGEEGWR